MGREWQIGDPVDYTTDGWMDAQNWGHGGDGEEECLDSEINSRIKKINEYSKKAWDLYMDYQDDEALFYINQALALNDMHSGNLNIKAMILESLKRYRESEKYYDRSLGIHKRDIVQDNKARMLFSWSHQLLEDSKKIPDGLDMLHMAKDKIIESINTFSKNTNEDMGKYYRFKDTIDFYIDYERKYQRNLEILKKYPKDELFTITGMQFHKTGVNFTPGMPLMLVREPDNEFGSDAIAVYAEGEKIGYVANKDYTKHEMTSSASELVDRVQQTSQASYLFYLERYVDVQFSIGRIGNHSGD